MLRACIAAVVVIGSLVFTGLVPAATIVGSNRSDTLRGTGKADRLSGRAGDDRLFGLRGNDVLIGGRGADLLVGGAGADRLVCGAGRDIASADASDVVAKDCETVRGRTAPPPPAALGSYCGSTSQGMPLCFEVVAGAGSTGRHVRRIQLAVQAA